MVETAGLSNRTSKRLVLVVEDDELNRAMLREMLGGDFEIIEAENGQVGLEQLARHYKDLSLVLLDVCMPVCDGFEFLERKRADGRYDAIPVIVATASSSAKDEVKCLELGANDFVLKPYNFEIMVNRLNNMIRLRESAAIVNQLTHDNVTGLFSKAFFSRRVEDLLAGLPGVEFDMACVEVVNFPVLTGRYGEANCDRLLRELADCLSARFPNLAAAGRIGSTKLAFLVERGAAPVDWDVLLADAVGGLSFANVHAKLGIVERVDRELPAPVTCNRALSAIAAVADRHDCDVALFDDELHQRQLLEHVIRESMEAALAESQFTVFYQPKHDVRTGRVGGAEALVRWSHPEAGPISPGVFIPVFERNGFITKLDFFVWEEACRELRRCRERGLPVVPVSVNVSRLDFDLPDLPARIAAIADGQGIDHSLLHVEITETAYSDNPAAVVKTLRELKSLGFSVELDDFGSGFSSLESLSTLPLDVMKLDMSMVRKAAELDDYRVLESTIKLARVLGLQTVVEGVETAAVAERVIGLGCDYIQGYHYARPMSREDFEAYLTS